jgi:hypothetical protein
MRRCGRARSFIGTTDTEPRKTSSDSGAYGVDIDMLTFMGGGFIAVQHGVLAWQETVGAERVEPTVDALETYKAHAGGG